METSKENLVLDWNNIYDRYFFQVKKVCANILGYNHIYLQDAISETFEKGMAKAHQYNPELAGINTWLCQIAINICLTIKKKEKRQTSIDDADFVQEMNEDDADLIKQMLTVINGMKNTREKEIFLRYFNGSTYEELAEEHNRNIITMRVIVSRFLSKLRKKLNRDDRFDSVKSKCVNFPKVRSKGKKKNKTNEQIS